MNDSFLKESLEQYMEYKNPDYRGFIHRDFYTDKFLKEIGNPDSLIESKIPLKKRGNSSTFTLSLNNDAKDHLFLKVKKPKNSLSAFTDSLSPLLNAKRNLIHYCAYVNSGFRTPKLIAIIESQKFYNRHRYTISKEVKDGATLRKYLQDIGSDESPTNEDRQDQVLKNVSKLARALHEKGIFHLDLNTENILLEKGNEDNLTVLDLEHSVIMPGYSGYLSGFLRFVDFIGINVWIAEFISVDKIEKFYYYYNDGKEEGKVSIRLIKFFSKHPFLYKKNTVTKKIFSWSVNLIRMLLYLFRGY